MQNPWKPFFSSRPQFVHSADSLTASDRKRSLKHANSVRNGEKLNVSLCIYVKRPRNVEGGGPGIGWCLWFFLSQFCFHFCSTSFSCIRLCFSVTLPVLKFALVFHLASLFSCLPHHAPSFSDYPDALHLSPSCPSSPVYWSFLCFCVCRFSCLHTKHLDFLGFLNCRLSLNNRVFLRLDLLPF